MAVDLNGKVFYFMMIFLNVLIGEEIEFWVYIVVDDEVYILIFFFVFDQLLVIGSVSMFYSVQLSLDGDLLISLDSFFIQACLQGLSFFFVLFWDYLNQVDVDLVSWLVSNSFYFQYLIVGDMFFFLVVDFDWIGIDILIIMAIE